MLVFRRPVDMESVEKRPDRVATWMFRGSANALVHLELIIHLLSHGSSPDENFEGHIRAPPVILLRQLVYEEYSRGGGLTSHPAQAILLR